MSISSAEARIPVLPLKDSVLLPYVATPLAVGRPGTVAAVQAAFATAGRRILVVAQRAAVVDTPGPGDLCDVGTLAVVKSVTPSGPVSDVVVHGIERVRVDGVQLADGMLVACAARHPVTLAEDTVVEALRREVHAVAARLGATIEQDGAAEVLQLLRGDANLMRAIYLYGSLFAMDREHAQALLEADTSLRALELLHRHLNAELQVALIRREIAERARAQLTREQREMVLRQQLKTIEEELSPATPDRSGGRALAERLTSADLPDAVRGEAERALARLAHLPSEAPEASVTRAHLECLLDLPWKVSSSDVLDLVHARQVMDEDHHGLSDVKDRVVEHLATMKLNPRARAPILCFVGPPGVGKTSVGRSIARALGRRFERLSLGGMHDEAELRGHRRTYVGAMPGRIVQALRRAGVNNPVIMLDEIDKLGRDFRGDPAAAMLEVLDPEQNCAFRDNYLDLPFDLSRVLFITTANGLHDVPAPLTDRMEVIALSGYCEEEKLAIARTYLLPRQLAQAGVPADAFPITDAALSLLIRRWTREAGVRQLERAVGRVVRKVAVSIATGEAPPGELDSGHIAKMLGAEPYFSEGCRARLSPGVATGLAWTEAGGEILYVECSRLPAERGLVLTGHLGGVMQESARAAHTYLEAHADELGIDPAVFLAAGVHVHVPAGAIPKDGPSAGVTMIAALASLYTGRPARADTAMTGEITLSGLVLPVGGVKEKVLAARRAGLARVVMPRRSATELEEMPAEVRAALEVVLVDRVEDVLEAALDRCSVSPQPPVVRALHGKRRGPARPRSTRSRGASYGKPRTATGRGPARSAREAAVRGTAPRVRALPRPGGGGQARRRAG